MTATIHAIPGPGPVFGGQAFQDNALALARAVYAADVPPSIFRMAENTLRQSPVKADRDMGNATRDARLLAMYDEAPYVHVEEPAPHAPGLIPGWLFAAGMFCCIGSVMIAGYVLSPIF